MTEHTDTITLFNDLMRLNERAFAAAHYTTAYHTLAAALTEAGDNTIYLRRVQQTAAEQLTEIDRTAPQYEYSTRSAAKRKQISIFATLMSQAHVRLVELETDRRIEKLHRRRTPLRSFQP